MNDSNPPLEGVKVIDFTRYLAGPFAAQILGDYGAEVIRIEPVRAARSPHNESGTEDYFFLTANRSKKSIALDTKKPEGVAVLSRLAESSDVLIDNFRPGVIDSMGLGYSALSERNPRIICCSISGFGATGPLRNKPGFDQIAQGMSGLMSVTGTEQSGPTRLGIAICDLLAGIFAAQGILLALRARDRTGLGQKVETSLIEGIMSVLSWSAGIFFETGKSPLPQGNHHPLTSPHGTFKAVDRPLNISVGNNKMWKKFVEVIGRPDLGSDERFSDQKSRVKNRAALTEEINRALTAARADQWVERFDRAGIPAGPILTMEEIFSHPQVAARQMLLRLPHPKMGTVLSTGLAAKLSRNPGRITRPPLLGEHTDEVLAANGFAPEQRAALRAARVIL